MKKINIFTNEFPYGYKEAYMEIEENFYDFFDEVNIFSLQVRNKENIRETKNINKVYPVFFAPRYKYFLNLFRCLNDENIYKEIKYLYKNKKLNLTTLSRLLVFISRAHYEKNIIIKNTKKEIFEKSIFYVYRFEYQPYVAMLINRELNTSNEIVCRAHRYDLYEYARSNDYIPLREEILKNIKMVYPCSDDGSNYLKGKFGDYKEKIKTSYLGTLDHGIGNYVNREPFKIVSCSTITKVKRVDRIIDALSKLSDIITSQIEWVHFGDGELKEEIITSAKNKLGNKINFEFKGNISHDKLMEIYKEEEFHLFINVSESEGLPVSIMEAISFSIPVIASDVGGTREIIEDNVNGILLHKDFEDIELINSIKYIMEIDENEYLKLRENARKIWGLKFNSDTNYREFLKEISK